METFQVALGECDLLTLANGQRTVPILTTRNPGGYTEKTLIFEDDGSYDVIPADDIYERVHDFKRLKVILNVVTGKDLHYLIKHVLTLANGQRTVPILTTRNPGGYSEKTRFRSMV